MQRALITALCTFTIFFAVGCGDEDNNHSQQAQQIVEPCDDEHNGVTDEVIEVPTSECVSLEYAEIDFNQAYDGVVLYGEIGQDKVGRWVDVINNCDYPIEYFAYISHDVYHDFEIREDTENRVVEADSAASFLARFAPNYDFNKGNRQADGMLKVSVVQWLNHTESNVAEMEISLKGYATEAEKPIARITAEAIWGTWHKIDLVNAPEALPFDEIDYVELNGSKSTSVYGLNNHVESYEWTVTADEDYNENAQIPVLTLSGFYDSALNLDFVQCGRFIAELTVKDKYGMDSHELDIYVACPGE